MKQLKLFFALFAMLALNVGNAWAEEVSIDFSQKGYSNQQAITDATITEGINVKFEKGSNSNPPKYYTSGTAIRAYGGNTFTISSTIGNITQIDLTFGSSDGSNAITTDAGNFSSSKWTGDANSVKFTIGGTSGNRRIKAIKVTYTPNSGGETPDPTTYTIKWHTAKGVTTDVTLNEGATITKPATDPTMTGYEFMGWTASCDVASNGSDFTALTDFGTADSDKDFYAVFAVATTTGGGAVTTTTASVVIKDYASAKSWANSTKYTTVEVDANITATVTGGTNTGKYYTSGNEWRLYQTESAKLTISAKNDININTVKVTYNQSNSGVLKLNSSNVTSGTVVKDVNASSITFSVGNSGSATNGQVKVTAMEVVYTSGGGGTTTYDNYITTCASGIEYIELGDAFKWSATEAEVTIDATDNVFPTLTNTHKVPVKYSSSDDAIASIASDGTITLNNEGIVTITAKYEGGISAGTGKEYKATSVTYSLKVNKAAPVASGTTYVKVTSTAGITDGEYLIVYEEGKVAFNGALTDLDAVGNTIEVTINNNTIAGTNYIDAATFTIDVTNGTILSASGKYIGKTANSNGLDVKTTAMTNTFAIDANGNAVITGNTAALRYNKTADQKRFRYYKDGGGTQEKIALYKKASSHTLTYGTCTNGSVSADVADGATVLSGTTITLSNTPTKDYKLSAYDVYKTGEESTKVTVADDNTFIMPEFDVTISATFELAKTLTGIEITNAATQTTFWQGETFNHNGLKVTAHFEGAEDEDVTSKITVTGSTATAGNQTVTVSYKEGEVTKDATYTITVKAIPNTKETAYTVADAFDIIDKLGDTDKMYITGFVSQADLEQSSIDQYKNADYWISADGTTNGQQLEAFRGKYLDNTDFTSVNQIMVGDEVIIYGKLTKYGSTYEFAAGNYLVSLKRDKQQPELSYTTTEYNVNLGEAFTAPTLNNTHNLTVTYSSNNEDVATVAADGAVTIKAAGTVKITASFAGNDDYVAGSASYTINITDPNQLEVTFDATQDLDDNNATKGAGKLTKTPITFACTDGILGSSTYGHYRIYANAKATFSAAEGYIITKVVLISTASGTSDYGPAKLSTEDGTYTYSGKEGTWVGEAYTVTLTASAQTRATLITVYYKQDNRVDAGLAWNPATVSLTVGDAFTAPKFSNPNKLTGIEFTSSNTELATVNNAGVISLVSGKTGTATITAKYAGDATYKAAEVTCVITVSPKSEKVVILAEYNGQWYALKAAYFSTYTNRLAAIPVNYVGGKLYNVAEADRATIEWQLAMNGAKATFKNGENYLTGANGTDLKLGTATFEWDYNGELFLTDGDSRTFIYHKDGYFRNYATSNAIPNSTTYSDKPVVTDPDYDTAIEIGSGDNTTVIEENKNQKVNVIVDRAFEADDEWYTLCVPFNMPASLIGTAYQLSGLIQKDAEYVEVNLAAKNTIEAGKPYLVKPNVTVNKFVVENVTIVNTTGESIAKSIEGLSVEMQGVINGSGTTGSLYWVGNSGYLYNDDVAKLGLRTYFNITTPSGIAPRMRVVAGENVETGVEDLFKTDAPVKVIENGQLIIIRDGVKYNVQGQKL